MQQFIEKTSQKFIFWLDNFIKIITPACKALTNNLKSFSLLLSPEPLFRAMVIWSHWNPKIKKIFIKVTTKEGIFLVNFIVNNTQIYMVDVNFKFCICGSAECYFLSYCSWHRIQISHRSKCRVFMNRIVFFAVMVMVHANADAQI